ncbi:uncharacterized protein LOC143423713 [Xylocopa sonorina]|uniref:uncharacterized protein LOC143423713 n=1 Tax=Xylocopa sonorina TaxID=1818115 RepID=UPI00403A81B1
MSAAYCGHLDVIEFLLNLGANRKAREKSGLTAAQLALKKNYLSIVALLKKKTEFLPNKTLLETDADTSERGADRPLQTRPEFAEPLKDYKDISGENDNIKECSTNCTGFYCKICKVNFHETTWRNHETSTLHVFNSKPKLTNTTIYGISKQNKGYQMLLNHGWDEQMKFDPQKALKHIQQVEEKAGEILTDRQEIVALDKRRNDDRVGMRALQKENCKKTWTTIGPLLLKISSKTVEELLVKDQKECDIEINKIRSNLKIKVNELRDLELNPPVPGLMLQPLSHREMSAINQVLGQSS